MMTDLLTSAQMRAIEAAAIGSGAVTGLELMERAGQGVVAAIEAFWPEFASGVAPGALPPAVRLLDPMAKPRGTPESLAKGASPRVRRVSVLCGPGNNGGDGYVVARLLKQRGWKVQVFAYGDRSRQPPDAAHNHARWCGIGPVGRLDDPYASILGTSAEDRVDLVVDALFGIGMTRAVPMTVQDLGVDLVNWMHRHFVTVPVVAVDMPSGLCADSGRNWGCELRAGLTVSFHAKKLGHVLGKGPELCGTVQVVDIGLPQRSKFQRAPVEVVQELGPARWMMGKWEGHKYSYGHALVLSGEPGAGGAARLAARGALRMGAGLVTVACPPEAVAEHAARLDAVMLRPVADGAALAMALEDQRINALCLGPGMGLDLRAEELVGVALGADAVRRGEPRPTVQDIAERLGSGAAGVGGVGLGADAAWRGEPRPTVQDMPEHVGSEGAGVGGVALGADAAWRGEPRPTVQDIAEDLGSGAAGVGGVALGADDAAWRGEPRPTVRDMPELIGSEGAVGRGSPRRALVLDADALTLIARDAALFAALHDGCVLTPHAGEFARLFPDIAARLAEPATKGTAYSKVDATRDAAQRAGCVVLFKGPDTVIAAPDGRCAINVAAYERAAPWLATAGAGDVLAGFITGLLARGRSPFEAACTGAWLHVECARSFGPGLIAEDLPEELPKVFRGLGV